MKKIIFSSAVMFVGIFFLTASANATNIKEGKWSMTMTIHADGMDEQAAEAAKEMERMSPEEKAMMQKMMGGMGMNMGGPGGGMEIALTQCLTNDNPVPEASDDEDCQQTHSMQGNTVNFEVTCPKGHSTGQVTYRSKNMTGTITSTQMERGKEITSNIDIRGEYVGPCDDSTTLQRDIPVAAEAMSDKELSYKEKELELKQRELELKEKELDMESGASAKTKKGKPSLNDVDNAVNTTNNVKNTFSGLRSLLGR